MVPWIFSEPVTNGKCCRGDDMTLSASHRWCQQFPPVEISKKHGLLLRIHRTKMSRAQLCHLGENPIWIICIVICQHVNEFYMMLQDLLVKGNGFHGFILLKDQFNFKWKIWLSRTFRQNRHTSGKMQLSNMSMKKDPLFDCIYYWFMHSADLLHTPCLLPTVNITGNVPIQM